MRSKQNRTRLLPPSPWKTEAAQVPVSHEEIDVLRARLGSIIESPDFDLSRRQKRALHEIRLALAGLSSSAVDHAATVQHELQNQILRIIELPEEYIASGLTILSGFSQIVAKKYSGEKVSVEIQQNERFLILLIKTPGGDIRERIEHDLALYGEIVAERASLEKLVDSRDILELKHQLQFARMQLEHKKELLTLGDERRHSQEHTIALLQEHCQRMVGLVETSLTTLSADRIIYGHLVSSLKRVHSDAVNRSLRLLREIVETNRATEESAAVCSALTDLERESPGILTKLRQYAEQISINLIASGLYNAIVRVLG